jgi:hypothetical protein
MQPSYRTHAIEPVLTLLPPAALGPTPAFSCCVALPGGTAFEVLAPGTDHGNGLSTAPAAQQHTKSTLVTSASGTMARTLKL